MSPFNRTFVAHKHLPWYRLLEYLGRSIFDVAGDIFVADESGSYEGNGWTDIHCIYCIPSHFWHIASASDQNLQRVWNAQSCITDGLGYNNNQISWILIFSKELLYISRSSTFQALLTLKGLNQSRLWIILSQRYDYRHIIHHSH